MECSCRLQAGLRADDRTCPSNQRVGDSLPMVDLPGRVHPASYGRNDRTVTDQVADRRLGDLASRRHIPPDGLPAANVIPACRNARSSSHHVPKVGGDEDRLLRRLGGCAGRCGSVAMSSCSTVTRHRPIKHPSRTPDGSDSSSLQKAARLRLETRLTSRHTSCTRGLAFRPYESVEASAGRTWPAGCSCSGGSLGHVRPYVGTKPCLSRHERYREQDPTDPCG